MNTMTNWVLGEESFMKFRLFENKAYYAAMLAIAIPVSIQSLFQASLSVIDQLMVGSLGEDSIASVGLGSRISFIYLVTLTAIASTASILISQFWGKKETNKIASTFGGTIMWGILVTTVFLFSSLFLSTQIMHVFTKDINVIQTGSIYMRIISLGYIPMLLIALYSSVLRSTGHVKSTMYAGLFAIILNTILNYILIFGKFGLPALGVYGTAYATSAARIIEALLILFLTIKQRYPGMFNIRELINISPNLMKKIFFIASALVVNEFLWALGETMYSVVYGRMGTDQIASMTLTYPIQSLSIGLFTGLSTAAGFMIGNKLGEHENQEAYVYSKRFIKLGAAGSMAFAIIIISFASIYISFFNVSEEIKKTTFRLLVIFSIVLFVKVSNMILGGIIKSGGIVKYDLMLGILGTWGIGVPVGFIASYAFKLNIEWVYIMICFEELVRLILGLKIMVSKKWIVNLTEPHVEIEEAHVQCF